MELNKRARKPDLTLFLDADDSVCRNRMNIRDEDKELFETQLSKMREKYYEAINYLLNRKEKIIKIDANGEKDEVLKNIISAINSQESNWLTIQPNFYLHLDNNRETTVQIDNYTIDDYAQEIFRSILPFNITNVMDMKDMLQLIKTKSENYVINLSIKELENVFLEFLKKENFMFESESMSSGVRILKTSYQIQLDKNIKSKLTIEGVILLGNLFHRELAITKILPKIDLNEGKFTSFGFVLLFLPQFSKSEHIFKKEFIRTINGVELNPIIRTFCKDEIVMIFISRILELIKDEYIHTISAFPELLNEINDFCGDLNLLETNENLGNGFENNDLPENENDVNTYSFLE